MTATPAVDVHAHVLIRAAEALVADEPGLAAARADEARAAGEASAAVNRTQIGAIIDALTDPTARLAAMDTAGVGVQLVSPMPIHHYWADHDLAGRYAHAVNDGVAEHCAHAPGRLLGLGTAPLQHPDLAVDVLTRAVDQGLRGVEVSTTVAGRELSDPDLDRFWTRAEDLDAVVFVHPWGCTLGERLDVGYLSNSVGNPTETTVALARLITTGTLDRHPGLRLLAAHGGGYLPAGIARLDHAWHARADARTCAEPPSAYLRRLWFDALVYTPDALRALVVAVGADRVALGTDYPFDMGIGDPLERLAKAGLDPSDTEHVRAGAASALLGA